MKKVVIYTDGACSGNPGPGGWGAILQYGEKQKEINGFEADTTNNRMELKAAIEALRSLKHPCHVELYSDSEYVRKGITEWLKGWQANGWRTSAKKAVKNADLWQELEREAVRHQISWHWVKGHSGHPMNERADALARQAIENTRKRGL